MPSSKAAQDATSGPSNQEMPAPASLKERLSQMFLKPAKSGRDVEPVPDRPMTDEEKRRWIRGLEPVERKWGFILSAYGALVALYINLPDLVGHHRVYEKITTHGHTHYAWVSTGRSAAILLAIQLVLALGCLVAAYFRKRPLLGFFLLIAAFASTVLGIPMLILAGWLFLRSWRVQRYGTTSAKVAAATAADRRKRGEKTGGLGGLFGRRSTPTTVEAKSSVTAGPRPAPEASKRYTPKKAKPQQSKSRAGASSKGATKSTKT